MAKLETRCFDVFMRCADAMRKGELIKKVSSTDKEYHFQHWFAERLKELKVASDTPGRNSYPDFTLVHTPEGYELKALAYPGRQATFDSNSRIPTGEHNGRRIFYVFGRYPKDKAKGAQEYPLIDLVVCHGDFMNADHDYVHENQSVRGFGSYGDIMIRDRKMYVAPTPFALLDGVTSLPTLIIPSEYDLDPRFREVGRLTRVECDRLVVGYEADLVENKLVPKYEKNPDAGKPHEFVACRLKTESDKPVKLVPPKVVAEIVAEATAEDEGD